MPIYFTVTDIKAKYQFYQTGVHMELLNKIKKHEAVIGVIGMGYVGLPLLLEFVTENFPTVGFDIDPQKVEALNKGTSYIKHIASERIRKAR